MDQTFSDNVRNMAMLLLKDKQPFTSEIIRSAVIAASVAIGAMGNTIDISQQELIAKEIETVFNIWVPDGTELLDPAGHVPWLSDKRGQITWSFWRRYELYLAQHKGFAPPIIARLDSLTDRILENLEDPKRNGLWDRRGMVVGQVQSGKTANYTGLICKAVDAGYKLIVVLAGVHNSLRSQTQIRLDEGFLGRDSQQSRAYTLDTAGIGVGKILLSGGNVAAHSLTTSAEDGDFKKAKASTIAMHLGSDPVILTVKKNSSVLKNLLKWVQTTSIAQRDASGKKVVVGLPVLILDDEADHASVNTKEYEVDESGHFKSVQEATAINKLIRKILKTFEQSAYVGYTATPFANIFIHPDIETTDEGEDLFPRSFILNLPAPSNYIGPVQVFGLGAAIATDAVSTEPLPVVTIVKDSESYIPSNHKQHHSIADIPPSMKEAIRAFVISCAARRARGQILVHNSMLIHVTRFNAVQRALNDLVNQELRSIKHRIEYGDGDRTPTIHEELQSLWQRDYASSFEKVYNLTGDAALTPIEWSDVAANLREAALKINVKIINGDVGDVLDYYDHPNGISVIAIGGDKLSRGLTLEGLTVSYYLRASKMYDTLMQMGRWFGYRPGYADLCRLYTTQELVDWYEHITVASEELRQEFDWMASARMTPKDYGLKVQTHPGGLVITSAGKMRYSKKVRVSFSSSLIQTYFLHKEKAVIDSNFDALVSFIKELGAESVHSDGDHIWSGVSATKVTDFLENMTGHPALPTSNPKKLAEYITTKASHGELTEWTVVLNDNKTKRDDDWAKIGQFERVGLAKRTPVDNGPADNIYAIKNRNFLSLDDELVDLSPEELMKANNEALKHWEAKQTSPPPPPSRPGGSFIRGVRPITRGLLLVYPLSPKADNLFDKNDPRHSGNPIVGLAISFPGTSRPDETVEYRVNTTYYEEELEALRDEA